MRIVDQVWNDIFTDYPILETIEQTGRFEISANQIRNYHEPRLVTKFDFRQALPEIMRKHGVSILPNTTGTYVVGKFDIFKDFPNESTKVYPVNFPKWIESIDPMNINSEAIAITAATITPMFQDFYQDERLVGTVSGRMGSGRFDFMIGNEKISVNSSQIEIDGALESPDRFVLLEGKNIIHDDFIVRQLYYPYRTFVNKVTKPIHSLFITYSNNVYRLMEYKFTDLMRYDSCEFVREKKYCIDLDFITFEDIEEVHSEVANRWFNSECPNEEETYGAPFPQCDSFSKIVSIIENLAKRSEMTEADIVELFGFTARQANYYFNGCRYLGMVQKDGGRISLTERGRCLVGMSYKERQLRIVSYIFEHPLFFDLFIHYQNLGKLERALIKRMMKYYKVCAEGVIDRRSSTVMCWFEWILGLVN